MRILSAIFFVLFLNSGLLYAQTTNLFPVTGNVGIGISSPISALHLSNNERSIVLRMGSVGNTLFESAIRSRFVDGNGSFLDFGNYAGSSTYNSFLTIAPSGYVGIGIKDPMYKLHVDMPSTPNGNDVVSYFGRSNGNTGGSSILRLEGASGSGDFEINSLYSATGIRYGSYGDLNIVNNIGDGKYGAVNFVTNKIVRMSVAPTGNVGIGTFNPNGLLTLHSTAQELNFLMNKKLTGVWPAIDELTTVTIQSSGSLAGNLAFATGNDERMRITAGGNVGIGTSDPKNCKLAVEGTIGAREVVVLAPGTAWPDYVFAPEYKLRTLDEIEQFVKAKQHLPDVPSAEAVAKDGVNLGEMNAILLRKVEELTLHLIEQNKKVESVIEQNKALLQEVTYLKGLVVK